MASKSRQALARKAYGDSTASKKLHSTKACAEMGHKSVAAAELDQHLSTAGIAAARGLVIMCAVLLVLCTIRASVGDLTRATFVLMSAFVTFATGLAYLSKRAVRDVEAFERARERWEADNFLQGEKDEMLELYEGYSREQAQQVVDILSTNVPAFVDIMMVEELGIIGSPSPMSVVLHSVLTFVATIVGGAVPALMMTLQVGSAGVLDIHSTAVLVTALVSGACLVGCGFLWVRVTIYSNAFGGAALLALGVASFLFALLC